MAGDWLKYDQVHFKDDVSFISLRVASASMVVLLLFL